MCPVAMLPRECPSASVHSVAMALCRQPSCLGPSYEQVGDGKMVWHVGMGKWAGQVGMRTRNRAHGAVSAPRGDNCAPGQDVSSVPARPTLITRLSVSGARKYNLCGYITRPAIYAGSQFTLGPLAHWPMHACATVQCPFANIGHGLLGACCSNAALTVHVRNVLYCAVLYCTALCCIVLFCVVLHCIVLYPTVFYPIRFLVCSILLLKYFILFSSILFFFLLFCCRILYSVVFSPPQFYSILFYFIIVYCTVLYCNVLYCTVLYCIVVYCNVLHSILLHSILL